MNEPTFAEISALAYQLYLEDGKPKGEAESHWFRAVEILTHPEMRSAENILSPPSEPELTRALDEKARLLDAGLPSDPHTGREAYHQEIELALGSRDLTTLKKKLGSMQGVEQVSPGNDKGIARISFDARKTNPAAIHEALADEDEPDSEVL